MKKEIICIDEKEYREILLQAVAVIETARSNIAGHIAVSVTNTYNKGRWMRYE